MTSLPPTNKIMSVTVDLFATHAAKLHVTVCTGKASTILYRNSFYFSRFCGKYKNEQIVHLLWANTQDEQKHHLGLL